MRRHALILSACVLLATPALAEPSGLGAPQPLSPTLTPGKQPPASPLEVQPLPPLPAPAATERPGDSLTVTLENDRLAGDRDKNYTHGTRLAWTSEAIEAPGWLGQLAAALPLLGKPEAVRLLLEVGQSMFTPETLSAATPLPGERPYVGWLYLGISALVESEDSLDRVGLLLGALGPAALAGPTQETVHGLFGMEEPRGWSSQPESRAGFVLLLDRFWKLVRATPEAAIQFEMLPHAGLAAGNVFSHASAGVLFRIGSDLAAEALPAAISPGLAPAAAAKAGDGGFRWALFVDLAGRAVANNVTVEGLDGEGPDANLLVGDVTAGLTLSWGGVSLTYARTLRTAEAEGQSGDDFGGLSVSLDF